LRHSFDKSVSLEHLSEPAGPTSLADLQTSSLDSLLISGGDTRLCVDPFTELNEYGCRPDPRPQAISFSSSTASSISCHGYAAARAALNKFSSSHKPVETEQLLLGGIEDQRTELAKLLGIDCSGAQIIFCPSGTDCQLHALYIARAIRSGPILTVVAASDETGRGTVYAATGRHYTSINSQGVAVKTGEPISELGSGISSISIPLRTNRGVLRPSCEIDVEVLRTISNAVESGLSVLFYRKSPSDKCIKEIRSRWPTSVAIVIDCCQFRASRKRIQLYNNSGCMVMLTGSKFFSGPPFSGALVVPSCLSERLVRSDYLPLGFRSYSIGANWPNDFTNIRRYLPSTINIGQFLRWTAAFSEMQRYYTIPIDFRMSFMGKFEQSVKQLFALSDGVRLIPLEKSSHEGADDEMEHQTIFSFFVIKRGEPMSLPDIKLLHAALNKDISELFSTSKSRILAARPCHVGQPVGIRTSDGFEGGAIRVSLGAANVLEAWSSSRFSKCLGVTLQVDKVRSILEKTLLISSHFDDANWREALRRKVC
jgi:hypothetical protein